MFARVVHVYYSTFNLVPEMPTERALFSCKDSAVEFCSHKSFSDLKQAENLVLLSEDSSTIESIFE